MNAWTTGHTRACLSSADVVLLQEPRLADEEQCRRAEDAAKKLGWQVHLNAAVHTDKGGVSAGVAVMAKKHIRMRFNDDVVSKRYRSRISCAWVGTGRRGGLHVLSIYLWTTEGMSERNRDL